MDEQQIVGMIMTICEQLGKGIPVGAAQNAYRKNLEKVESYNPNSIPRSEDE